MAARLKQLQSKAGQATQFVSKHGTAWDKLLMEQNKHIPGRYESFWKEVDFVKHMSRNRHEVKVEDDGIAAVFGLRVFVLVRLWEGVLLSLVTMSENHLLGKHYFRKIDSYEPFVII
ncbi:hypothetical protein ACH5RR_021630 [Cinchona calisaya]|uniref:Uncharacterized protein n=1 Tax=Cinchona calisaya TaxID=153742 RepID=A0ABD2ZJM0_9GENT